MTAAVVIRELRCQRGPFTLGPLSFTVPAGGRAAIVGPSGCGKTTLLRCLAGLQAQASGSIAIGGATVADGSTRVAPDRRGVGLVFQDGALWPHLTALQHLQFAAPKLSVGDARALLLRGGLLDLQDRKPGAMSGGQAQRLGLLRAIAPSPAVLLLDEPLRSVDVHQRDALVLLLRTLADERGLTTILVTHDRDEALALATDLVVLHEGRLVEQGPALHLLRDPATAFTAAFLAGAACLPATAAGHDRVATAFGEFERPAGSSHAGSGDLRLVLLPGETTAAAPSRPAQGSAAGRVIATLPADHGFTVRAAVGDQIVVARATHPLPAGSPVTLTMQGCARLLPWHRGNPASTTAPPPR